MKTAMATIVAVRFLSGFSVRLATPSLVAMEKSDMSWGGEFFFLFFFFFFFRFFSVCLMFVSGWRAKQKNRCAIAGDGGGGCGGSGGGGGGGGVGCGGGGGFWLHVIFTVEWLTRRGTAEGCWHDCDRYRGDVMVESSTKTTQ